LPEASRVLVAEGVCDAWEPAPVIRAVLVREAAEVTQVAQAIVPVVVIVPPVMGLVVAMLVTVPEPAGVAQVLSPRRKVLELGLPVAVRSAMAIPLEVRADSFTPSTVPGAAACRMPATAVAGSL
jgi:hypothetical protein